MPDYTIGVNQKENQSLEDKPKVKYLRKVNWNALVTVLVSKHSDDQNDLLN